jgi:hypothetical protein
MEISSSALLRKHGLSAEATEVIQVIQVDDVSIVLRVDTARGPVVLKARAEAEGPATELATNGL